jgi:hypothetical protein
VLQPPVAGAFAGGRGKTWEANWVMEFARA